MSDLLESTVEATGEGVVLRVRAQPGAKRNGVTGVREGELCVAVTAPPDRGRANEAIIRVLADTIGAPRSRVRFLSGETNRHKRLLIEGASLECVVATLRLAMGGSE